MNKNQYYVLAFYHFVDILSPHDEVKNHKKFFEDRDITSRIYLSEQGINGQMSAAVKDAEEYMQWMLSRDLFHNVHFKIHTHPEHAFPKVVVKYRKDLVGFDRKIDLTKRGEYVSPKEWKDLLSNSKNHVLLDVRNDYEWKIGHFEGAELPHCETFREFDKYAENLQKSVDAKTTPVLMYCTGGIRCELYSSILKERGFDKVYQLQGGIINYGLEEGSKHWKGKLFVFDDRLAVPIGEEATPVIGTCHHCKTSNETYLNCANIDCNNLFLCCPDCLTKFQGCCQESCQNAERIRPFHKETAHKPFRKWHEYRSSKKSD